MWCACMCVLKLLPFWAAEVAVLCAHSSATRSSLPGVPSLPTSKHTPCTRAIHAHAIRKYLHMYLCM